MQVAYEGKPFDEVISEFLENKWHYERTKLWLATSINDTGRYIAIIVRHIFGPYCSEVMLGV